MERERLEVDALFVGAGPAGLAGAWRLAELARAAGRELSIMVLEKGEPLGAHALSGCVLDPRALRELCPDFIERGCPLEAEVQSDRVYYLGKTWKLPLPFTPPPMRNHGNYVAALGKLVPWMGAQVEALGVNVFCGFPAVEPLVEGEAVRGVRAGDKGVDKHGRPKGNFEPGMDIVARLTVLCEGPRGTLSKILIPRLGLDHGRQHQAYATGLKEVWKLPAGRMRAGEVVHTMGFPLDFQTFGGGFVYGMQGDLCALGLVVGLEYADPLIDLHALFSRFKTHPWVRGLLAGGELLHYGAKTIPEGGVHAMPRLYADGLLLAGDCAGFLNGKRLKGVHLAMKSGMLAAETAFAALAPAAGTAGAGDVSAASLAAYERAFRASWAFEELWNARHFHHAFRRGFLPGLFHVGLQELTHGRGLYEVYPEGPAPHESYRTLAQRDGAAAPPAVPYDDQIVVNRLKDVYFSGTKHEEDQPCHLKVADLDICSRRCPEEFGNPCEHFCPAQVYEMVEAQGGGRRLQLNFSNCVHCKTCDIKDPYQIITWTPPEGGGGPQYGIL